MTFLADVGGDLVRDIEMRHMPLRFIYIYIYIYISWIKEYNIIYILIK